MPRQPEKKAGLLATETERETEKEKETATERERETEIPKVHHIF